jgi:hypothetical protein
VLSGRGGFGCGVVRFFSSVLSLGTVWFMNVWVRLVVFGIFLCLLFSDLGHVGKRHGLACRGSWDGVYEFQFLVFIY